MRLSAKFLDFHVLFSFGAIEAMRLALPLLVFPYLGRILGPESFGLLMYMCLFPPITTLFMDWGFPLGAVRQAARLRGQDKTLAKLVEEVFSAKIILALACCAAGIIILPVIPHAKTFTAAYFMAIFLGIARGISPVWFYQGIGSGMKRLALWDVSSSLLALLLVFCLVRNPNEWQRYLLLTAICKTVAYLWLNFCLWRKYYLRLSWKKGIKALKENKTIFAGNFYTNIYNYGSQIIFGYFLAAPQMGIIVAVNKMLRALVSLINPFNQTIFPEICVINSQNPEKSVSILRYAVIGTLLTMFFITCVVWFCAPWLIYLALGNGYAGAPQCLGLMALAAPFMACNHILTMQGLVSSGHEKAVATTRMYCALASFPAAALFAYAGGLYGSSLLLVCVEICMFISFIWMIKHYSKNVT